MKTTKKGSDFSLAGFRVEAYLIYSLYCNKYWIPFFLNLQYLVKKYDRHVTFNLKISLNVLTLCFFSFLFFCAQFSPDFPALIQVFPFRLSNHRVWIYRYPVVGTYFTPVCISFSKSTRIFQTCSRITRTLFNDLLMDYVIRGWKCHFCHNRRYVFWKKNITFSSRARKVFVPKHKTYNVIPARNVSLTKARVKEKTRWSPILYRPIPDGEIVGFAIAWKLFVLVVFTSWSHYPFSSTMEMLTLAISCTWKQFFVVYHFPYFCHSSSL